MPRQLAVALENNFTKGLITEAPTLNFPENAVIETYNCVFNRTGGVSRRLGIDYELNYTTAPLDRSSKAISSYKWNNAGGSGLVELLAKQIGAVLYFYDVTAATIASPLSTHRLNSVIALSDFVATGGNFDVTKECQYADGDGYLFIFHPSCNPIYCTYVGGVITGRGISLKNRDFNGITEAAGIEDNFRPVSTTPEHLYNLRNQGWTNSPTWTASSSTSNNTNIGSKLWIIETGLTIANGDSVQITTQANILQSSYNVTLSGSVISYASGNGELSVNVLSTTVAGGTGTNWSFLCQNAGVIDIFQTASSKYPSNADVWWRFKTLAGVYAPNTTLNNVSYGSGAAPKGFYLLEAFNQLRSTASGIALVGDASTTARPSTGAWFQGRVWYSGISAAQTVPVFYTWTENIYFSQIIENVNQFGKCYQVNDPTDENLFDLLPSDGGLIRIQGCGGVYKLFPIQNGILVFAANGIWFITGSQGIGFTANDYTITKLSSIQALSHTSIVDVQGYPMWWNAEGIYAITNSPDGLQVKPLTFSTIQTFFDGIPLSSKRYARGVYDPLSFRVHWCYKTTTESSVTNRYELDGILVYDTALSAFYPHILPTAVGTPVIHGPVYIQGPGGSSVPPPVIKYICSVTGATYNFTFAEENDTDYLDWTSKLGTGVSFSSYFITGFKVRGEAIRKFQSNWLRVYTDNEVPSVFDVQYRWDAAISGNTGRWTSLQRITMDHSDLYDTRTKRLKIRGSGLINQTKIASVTGQPFDIVGWSTYNSTNGTV